MILNHRRGKFMVDVAKQPGAAAAGAVKGPAPAIAGAPGAKIAPNPQPKKIAAGVVGKRDTGESQEAKADRKAAIRARRASGR
jgi:hypothetical protein